MKTKRKNHYPTNERRESQRLDPAVEQTMRLYHAWLGYLLTRLGESEVRVPVEDIRRALKTYVCESTREDDSYVIRVQRAEGEEVGHDSE